MKSFVTSDLHLGHRKLAVLRGFLRAPEPEEIQDPEEVKAGILKMDTALIDGFNSTVSSKDTTYIIGDFSFHNDAKSIEILKQLNGIKILVEGNHDKKRNKLLRKFLKVDKLLEFKYQVKDESYFIVMCHYPMLIWNKHQYGSIHLHGHSHGNLINFMPDYYKRRVMDVSVDAINSYFPLELDEICNRLKHNNIQKLDHHYEE